MSAEWTKLKSEINKQVEELKANVHRQYSAEYEKKDIYVSVKFKDNAKEATVKIINKNKTQINSELQINLKNSQNLAKRFDGVLSDFNSKNS